MLYVLFIITAFAIIVFSLSNYYLIKNENERIETNLNIEKSKIDKKIKELQIKYDNSYKNYFGFMDKNYGRNLTENVKNNLISLNMPSELLILSWGGPDLKKEKIHKNDFTEYWYYNKYINRLGNTKYKTEVTIENFKVIGWRDLN